jgi:predicted peptidase
LGFGLSFASADDLKRLDQADNGTFKAADGVTLLYALAEPQAPKAGQRYPLVIFLHGAGGIKPAGERNPKRSWDGGGQFFETMTEDCYFFLPQAAGSWSGIPWDKLPYKMRNH